MDTHAGEPPAPPLLGYLCLSVFICGCKFEAEGFGVARGYLARGGVAGGSRDSLLRGNDVWGGDSSREGEVSG